MMPVMINDVSVDCINNASIAHHVPATVILSVMRKEGGKNGQAVRNENGTIDYGVLQINSIWLPKIAAYGYTKNDLQFNACKNVYVGAWIISQSIASSTSLWSGVAAYHSRTPAYHEPYKKSIYANYNKLVSTISG